MKKHSHVLLPVLAPEPEKVNPLGLAGGKEEVLFQKELSEGSLVCVERKNYTLIKKETRWFICFFRSEERNEVCVRGTENKDLIT